MLKIFFFIFHSFSQTPHTTPREQREPPKTATSAGIVEHPNILSTCLPTQIDTVESTKIARLALMRRE
jgi:hypothetical protein